MKKNSNSRIEAAKNALYVILQYAKKLLSKLCIQQVFKSIENKMTVYIE